MGVKAKSVAIGVLLFFVFSTTAVPASLAEDDSSPGLEEGDYLVYEGREKFTFENGQTEEVESYVLRNIVDVMVENVEEDYVDLSITKTNIGWESEEVPLTAENIDNNVRWRFTGGENGTRFFLPPAMFEEVRENPSAHEDRGFEGMKDSSVPYGVIRSIYYNPPSVYDEDVKAYFDYSTGSLVEYHDTVSAGENSKSVSWYLSDTNIDLAKEGETENDTIFSETDSGENDGNSESDGSWVPSFDLTKSFLVKLVIAVVVGLVVVLVSYYALRD